MCLIHLVPPVLAGPSGQNAFEPLAALLLQHEALQRSESDSDGPSKSAKGPVRAPGSADMSLHALHRPGDFRVLLLLYALSC